MIMFQQDLAHIFKEVTDFTSRKRNFLQSSKEIFLMFKI